MENKYDNNYFDKDIMKTLIDDRNPSHYLIPIYINLFGKKYAILDIGNITQSFPLSAFRVGFGTSHSVIGTKNFPTGEMYKYNCEESFKYTDEETSVDTYYFIIEESFMNESDNPIDKEINMWINALYNKVEDNVKRHREEMNKLSQDVSEPIETEDDEDEDDSPCYAWTTEDGDEYFE